MRTLILALPLLLAACTDRNHGGPPDLTANYDLAGPIGGHPDLLGAHPDLFSADLAQAGDGGSCAVSTSPSGYACDPWSVHLYGARFVSAGNGVLRLELWHDPSAYEGSANDTTWPVAHDFKQYLTVDFPIDDALRNFLCVVFASSTPPTAYPVDATLLNLNKVEFPLTLNAQTVMYRWQDVSDLCGVPSLPVVVTPNLVMQATLPDVAVMIPLLPDPRNMIVGDPVSGWLARGILGADEDRELVPMIHGTVVNVITMPCPDRLNGIC
jgi:hypothetical protein